MKADEYRCFYALELDPTTSPECTVRNYSLATSLLQPEGYEVICGPDLKSLPSRLLYSPNKYSLMVIYVPSVALFNIHYNTIQALTPKLPFIVLLDGQTDRLVQVSMLMMKGCPEEDGSSEFQQGDGFVQFLYAVGTALNTATSKMSIADIFTGHQRNEELFSLVKRSNKSEEINLFNTGSPEMLSKKFQFEVTTSTPAGFDSTILTVRDTLKLFMGTSSAIKVNQNLNYHEFRIEFSSEGRNGGVFAIWLANVLNEEKEILSASVEYIGEAIYTITISADELDKFLSVINNEKESLCPDSNSPIVKSSVPIEISFISHLFHYGITSNMALFAEFELMMRQGMEEKQTGLRIEEVSIPVVFSKKVNIATTSKAEHLFDLPEYNNNNIDDNIHNNSSNKENVEVQSNLSTSERNDVHNDQKRTSVASTNSVYQLAECVHLLDHNPPVIEDTGGPQEAPPANAPPPLLHSAGRGELPLKNQLKSNNRGRRGTGVLSPSSDYDLASFSTVHNSSVHNIDTFSTPLRGNNNNNDTVVNKKTNGVEQIGLNVSSSAVGMGREIGSTPAPIPSHTVPERSDLKLKSNNNYRSLFDSSDDRTVLFSSIPPEPTPISSSLDLHNDTRGTKYIHPISPFITTATNSHQQYNSQTASSVSLYKTPPRVMSPSITSNGCINEDIRQPSKDGGNDSPTRTNLLVKYSEEVIFNPQPHPPQMHKLSSITSSNRGQSRSNQSASPFDLEEIINTALERQHRIHEEQIRALSRDLRNEMNAKFDDIYNKLRESVDVNSEVIKTMEGSMEDKISHLRQKVNDYSIKQANNTEVLESKTSKHLDNIDKNQSLCSQAILEFRKNLNEQSAQLIDINEIIQQISTDSSSKNKDLDTNLGNKNVMEASLSRVEIEDIARGVAVDEAQHVVTRHNSLHEKIFSAKLQDAIKGDLEGALKIRILSSEARIMAEISKLKDSVAIRGNIERELKEIREYQDSSFEKVVSSFTRRLVVTEEKLRSLSNAADYNNTALGSRTPNSAMSFSRNGSLSDMLSIKSDGYTQGLLSPRHEEVEFLKTCCSKNANDLKDVGNRIRQIEVAQAEVSNVLSIEDQHLQAIKELDNRLLNVERRVL